MKIFLTITKGGRGAGNLKFKEGYDKHIIDVEDIIKYRIKWIESNGEWFSKDSKPINWNMEQQLKNINIGLNK